MGEKHWMRRISLDPTTWSSNLDFAKQIGDVIETKYLVLTYIYIYIIAVKYFTLKNAELCEIEE